ncbi:hypothetical protein V2J09_009374 [Rumex salicifolius]
MNALLWNCRGASKTVFANTVNYLIRHNSIRVLSQFETKISKGHVDAVCKKIKMTDYHRIEAEGITVEGQVLQFVFTYAPLTDALSDELVNISESIFVGGEFNCITNHAERQGGLGLLHNDSSVFRDLIDMTGLIDMGFYGQSFTWSKGLAAGNHIAKRLDRILMNNHARLHWSEAMVFHIPKFNSDHTPLLFCLSPPTSLIVGGAKWPKDCPAVTALAKLSPQLIKLNKIVFDNIHERKKEMIKKLDRIQTELGSNKELETILEQEELLWRQKSQELWLIERDRKTSFFHASTVVRHKRKKIDSLQDDNGCWVDAKSDVEDLIMEICNKPRLRNSILLPSLMGFSSC